MSDVKTPLTVMPEVLPRPAQAGGTSVRARTVARMKTLAAAGVTSVIASCGYGVVDPMPSPSCFSSPQPTAVARYLDAAEDGGAAGEGERIVEVKVSFTQTGVTLGAVTAMVAGTNDPLVVVESQILANEVRVVFRVPRKTPQARVYVESSCATPRDARSLQVSLNLTPETIEATAY